MSGRSPSRAGAEAFPNLFSPGRIGGVAIQNRIVQTPMGTALIEQGRVTDRDIAFQEERARAGVGLIITGAAPVHPTSGFSNRILTEAWDEGGIPAQAARRCRTPLRDAHLRPAPSPRP